MKRLMTLAVATLFGASVFAATDLTVSSAKQNLFLDSGSTSLVVSGFLVTSGSVKILNHTNPSNQKLDVQTSWKNAGMPTTLAPVGILKYVSAYPGINEGSGVPQCVHFVKSMTATGGTASSSWVKGLRVSDAILPSDLMGRAIATFNGPNGTYYGHAVGAVLSTYFSGGKLVSAVVVDENYDNDGRIKKRTMTVGTGTLNPSSLWDLRNYYVIQK